MNRYSFLPGFFARHFSIRFYLLVGLIALMVIIPTSMQAQQLDPSTVSFDDQSLLPEQIDAPYTQGTGIIVSLETYIGDSWQRQQASASSTYAGVTHSSPGYFRELLSSTKPEMSLASNWVESVNAPAPGCPADMNVYYTLDETAAPFAEFSDGPDATCTNCPSSATGLVNGA